MKRILKHTLCASLLLSTNLWASEASLEMPSIEVPAASVSTFCTSSDDDLLGMTRLCRVGEGISEESLRAYKKNYPDYSSVQECMKSIVVALQVLESYHFKVGDAFVKQGEYDFFRNAWPEEDRKIIDFNWFVNQIDTLLDIPKAHATLRSLIPESIVSPQTWDFLKETAHNRMLANANQENYMGVNSKEEHALFIGELYEAVQRIDACEDILSGDTLVGVGNTPQFVLEMHRYHGHKNLNYLQIPLSGNPGSNKIYHTQWFKSILSETGLKNYRDYLTSIDFLEREHRGRMVFLDVIGSGKGPLFLINEYLKHNVNIPPESIILMGINPLKNWSESAKNPGVKTKSLDLPELTKTLDRVSDEEGSPLRYMPPFPASYWGDTIEMPAFPIGKEAQEIVASIAGFTPPGDAPARQTFFNRSLFLEKDHDTLNYIELGIYKGKTQWALEELDKFDLQPGDVASIISRVIISDNNLDFCEKAAQKYAVDLKTLTLSDFEKEFTDKEKNIQVVLGRMGN